MTENKWFNDFRGYKRFDSYFDDYMQLWVVSDNENDNILYPCISENMVNEFIKLLNELNDENQVLREQYADDCNEANSMTVKISELIEENEQLKQKIKKLEAQLYKVEDGVCDICNNMYLVQQGRYFVSKCKKGHDECSRMDLDYCDDFELKDGDV